MIRYLLPLLLLCGAAPALAKKPMPSSPICSGAQDCEVKWGRAVSWVLQHNPNVVQRTNDFLVTQPGLGWGEDKIQINRIPVGGGRYEIAINIECASLLKCNIRKSVESFVNAVNDQGRF